MKIVNKNPKKCLRNSSKIPRVAPVSMLHACHSSHHSPHTIRPRYSGLEPDQSVSGFLKFIKLIAFIFHTDKTCQLS